MNLVGLNAMKALVYSAIMNGCVAPVVLILILILASSKKVMGERANHWPAKIVGGIVETAGFGCALETPQIEAAADTDGADMRRLVEALAMECEPVAFKELVGIARKNGCFEWIIGITDNDLKPAETSRFGRLLARYDKRQVGIHHFLLEGKGHGKRFRAKMLEQ